MLTLGKPRRVRVLASGLGLSGAAATANAAAVSAGCAEGGSDQEAWVEFRDCTADEWTKFQGEMAEVMAGEKKGERLTMLCYQFGRELILDAGGFDVPDGMEQKEALCSFAPDIVADLGDRMFMRGGGRKLDLGKSVLPHA